MILDEINKNTNLNENEQQILKTNITQHLDEIPTLSSRELARKNLHKQYRSSSMYQKAWISEL